MNALSGSNCNNDSFDGETILAVWLKGKIIPGFDPIDYRLDIYDHIIKYECYGKKGRWGWTIGCIYPPEERGIAPLYNLHPLFWQNINKSSNTKSKLKIKQAEPVTG